MEVSGSIIDVEPSGYNKKGLFVKWDTAGKQGQISERLDNGLIPWHPLNYEEKRNWK